MTSLPLVYRILRTVYFNKWFEKQDKEIVEEVVIGVKRLACGNFSNCKMLRQGIFELKMHYGTGIRVYYIRRGSSILILLCGGADEKQQKTDRERAVRIRKSLNNIGDVI